MSHQPNSAFKRMEGNGSYNKHAKQPAEGAALALPHLERVVEIMSSIAQIGLSSLPTMDRLRARIRSLP